MPKVKLYMDKSANKISKIKAVLVSSRQPFL